MVFPDDPYARKLKRRSLLVLPVTGLACALFGHAIGWAIGAGGKATNLIAAVASVAGLFTAMVMIFRRSLKERK
jgi:hypothetical protein